MQGALTLVIFSVCPPSASLVLRVVTWETMKQPIIPEDCTLVADEACGNEKGPWRHTTHVDVRPEKCGAVPRATEPRESRLEIEATRPLFSHFSV